MTTALAVGMIGAEPVLHASAAGESSSRDARAAVGEAGLPGTFFTLTRRNADESGGVSFKIVTLRCEPTGGTHPAARAACAELLRSDGALESPPDGTFCPMIYAPVRVTADGYWRHRFEHFRKTYGNDCIMRSRTGHLFQF